MIDAEQLIAANNQLDRLDRHGGRVWTRPVLRLIEKYPNVSVAALARHAKRDRGDMLREMHRIDELGVTVRTGAGYRLSDLGQAVLHPGDDRLP
ncbi:MAG: hypothetical protein WD023_00840 [Ilumatobacteraceae bacterium]